MWRRRVLIILVCLLCGAAAATAASLRTTRYVATVSVALGAVAPLGWVEQPLEMARRMASQGELLQLAGMPVKDAHTFKLSTKAEVVDNDRVVAVTIEGLSKTHVAEVARKAVAGVKASHDEIWTQAIAANTARIEELEGLLASMRSQLHAGQDASGAPRDPQLLEMEERNRHDRWSTAVSLAKHITNLKQSNLPPKAFPTRVVAGPDVVEKARRPSRLLALMLGLVSGFMLAALFIAATEAVAPHL